ncbi:MAG: TetR/AcrR family transcriptional regulator [Micromonosporaceae bacterium]
MTGEPRTGRRRPTREQTRQRVLDAAERVFAERGIDNASVDDVAAAAGLTKGAVYSNFRSKNDLVLALMSEHVAQRQADAVAAFQGAADTAGALREAGARLVAAIRSDARWQRLLISYAVRDDADADVLGAMRERRRELRTALATLIEKLADEHGLRLAFPPGEAAVVVLALSNGFAVESGLDPGAVPEDLFGRVLAVLAGTP